MVVQRFSSRQMLWVMLLENGAFEVLMLRSYLVYPPVSTGACYLSRQSALVSRFVCL